MVEAQAGDRLRDKRHPSGRLFYAASTMVCVPAKVGAPLGSRAGSLTGEPRLREGMTDGEFRHVNRVIELRARVRLR